MRPYGAKQTRALFTRCGCPDCKIDLASAKINRKRRERYRAKIEILKELNL